MACLSCFLQLFKFLQAAAAGTNFGTSPWFTIFGAAATLLQTAILSFARVHLESLQADSACSIAPRQSRQSKHGDYGQTSGLLALSAEDAYSLLCLSL